MEEAKDAIIERVAELALEQMSINALRIEADEEVHARYPFLEHYHVRGIPLRALYLAKEAEFNKLVDERYELITSKPQYLQSDLKVIEEKLHDKANEIANSKLEQEAQLIAVCPECTHFPKSTILSSIPLFNILTEDKSMKSLLTKRMELSSATEPSAVKELENVERSIAQKITNTLAEDIKYEMLAAKARLSVLHTYPMCARDVTETVRYDTAFSAMCAERERLLTDTVAHCKSLINIEENLCERGVFIETKRRRRNQPSHLPRLLEISYVEMENGEMDADVQIEDVNPVDYHALRHYPELKLKQRRRRQRKSLNNLQLPTFTDVELNVAGEIIDDVENLNAHLEVCVIKDSETRTTVQSKDDIQRHRRIRQRRSSMPSISEIEIPEGNEIYEHGEEVELIPLWQRVVALEKKDPYYQELSAIHSSILAEGLSTKITKAALRCVEEQMRERVEQLHDDSDKVASAERRLEKQWTESFPFLQSIPMRSFSEMKLHEDGVLMSLAREYVQLESLPDMTDNNRLKLADVAQAMKVRLSELVANNMQKEEVLRQQMPFIKNLPGSVPLREISVFSHPEFNALYKEYQELCHDPISAKSASAERLEYTMYNLAVRIAEDEAEVLRRALIDEEDMHEQYPFLPDVRLKGLTFADLDLFSDTEFRNMANTLTDLRKAPEVDAEHINAVQEAMCSRVQELADTKIDVNNKLKAQYPFLSDRVNGILLSNLPLHADSVFIELSHKLHNDCNDTTLPDAHRLLLQDECSQRVAEISLRIKSLELYHIVEDNAVKCRYPFLLHYHVRGIPLRLFNLSADVELSNLMAKRVQLLSQYKHNSKSVRELDSQLSRRVLESAESLLRANDRDRKHYFSSSMRDKLSFVHVLSFRDDESINKHVANIVDAIDKDKLQTEHVKKRLMNRGDCLCRSYLESEEELAQQLEHVRLTYFMCGVDVNPVIESDIFFRSMLSTYNECLKVLPEQNDNISNVECELWKRAISLIGHEGIVFETFDALAVAEANLQLAETRKVSLKYMNELQQQRDRLFYKYKLWQRRQERRHAMWNTLNLQSVIWGSNYQLIDGMDEISPFLHDNVSAMEFPFTTSISATSSDSVSVSKRVIALAENDPYYLSLQRQQVLLKESANLDAEACVKELLKIRLAQLRQIIIKVDKGKERVIDFFVRRYPFLSTLCSQSNINSPLLLLCLSELDVDAVFRSLATERSELLKPSGDLRERYPFLPAMIDEVPISELNLEHDTEFMRLAMQRNDLLEPLRRQQNSVIQVEEKMRVRFAEILSRCVTEEQLERSKYRFLEPHHLPVPLSDLDLEHNVLFTHMNSDYEQIMQKITEHNRKELVVKNENESNVDSGNQVKEQETLFEEQRVLEAAMRDLVRQLASDEFLWQQHCMLYMEELLERYPFLPVQPCEGVYLHDVNALDDYKFRVLALELDEKRTTAEPDVNAVKSAEHKLTVRVEELAKLQKDRTEEMQNKIKRFYRCQVPRRLNNILLCEISDKRFHEILSACAFSTEESNAVHEDQSNICQGDDYNKKEQIDRQAEPVPSFDHVHSTSVATLLYSKLHEELSNTRQLKL